MKCKSDREHSLNQKQHAIIEIRIFSNIKNYIKINFIMKIWINNFYFRRNFFAEKIEGGKFNGWMHIIETGIYALDARKTEFLYRDFGYYHKI
jgi:hypothetical protein